MLNGKKAERAKRKIMNTMNKISILIDTCFKTLLVLLLLCLGNYLSALNKQNYEMITKNQELMEEIKELLADKSGDFEFNFPEQSSSWMDK